MTAHPQPPPEAVLIRLRREALVPRLSMSAAARRAAADGQGGFSVALWTKIENGYDQVARRVVVPYAGTADKVARMARVTGVTAEELESCGRGDAARILGVLLTQDPEPAGTDELTALRQRFGDLERKQQDDSRRMDRRLENMQRQMAAEFEEKLERALREREQRDKEGSHDQASRKRRAI